MILKAKFTVLHIVSYSQSRILAFMSKHKTKPLLFLNLYQPKTTYSGNIVVIIIRCQKTPLKKMHALDL